MDTSDTVDRPTAIQKVAKKWGIPVLNLMEVAGFNIANNALAKRYGALLNLSKYDSTKGYKLDQQVIYNDSIYKASEAIDAPAGDFDESKWVYMQEDDGSNYDKLHCNSFAYSVIAPKVAEFVKAIVM